MHGFTESQMYSSFRYAAPKMRAEMIAQLRCVSLLCSYSLVAPLRIAWPSAETNVCGASSIWMAFFESKITRYSEVAIHADRSFAACCASHPLRAQLPAPACVRTSGRGLASQITSGHARSHQGAAWHARWGYR